MRAPGLVPGGVEGTPGENLGAQPAVGEGEEEGEDEQEEEKDRKGGGWANVPTCCEQSMEQEAENGAQLNLALQKRRDLQSLHESASMSPSRRVSVIV